MFTTLHFVHSIYLCTWQRSSSWW